jgi:hypothetical protein
LRSRFRHYTNLHRTEERLDSLLRDFRFQRFQDLLSADAATGLEESRVTAAVSGA